MASTSGLASATNTAFPTKIRLPAGSPVIGSRQISTLATSTLSSAQPVTGIAPTTLEVLFTGVSKLPNGAPGGLIRAAFTWIVCGELVAAGAVTVTVPDGGPSGALTKKDPLPVPDGGETRILSELEDTVQFEAPPLLKLTATCCGLVAAELLTAKFKTLRLSDIVVATMVVGSEKFTVAAPPPDTLTKFTCGEVAVAETFTVIVITG